MIIGVISLTGILVNDGIVMISTMNEIRERARLFRWRPQAPQRGGCGRPSRPPLAMSAPLWYPLASAIIWGLIAATVFAMLSTPALYLLVTNERGVAGDPVDS
jgi:multidrug efflux pump subunit AcrB